ncbi:lipoprotein nlpC [Martelella alba]|uniref:Lipoprotein nlpC n=2 Tax=Martelella alba TaxID=2590451 RepID=A0ABY2SFB3_9HYPH|nr:lipoprotein nlpC [Martelella alba]
MHRKRAHMLLTLILSLVLAGCARQGRDHSASSQGADGVPATDPSDLIPVVAALHDQMHTWHGTPYQWGGTKLTGVDCSGFVWRTLKDRFNLPVARLTTLDLVHMGTRVNPSQLQPGDLVFFRIKGELHVGFYDVDNYFLHASVSQGVVRSSLTNPYWKSVFYQARRLQREYHTDITMNKSSLTAPKNHGV